MKWLVNRENNGDFYTRMINTQWIKERTLAFSSDILALIWIDCSSTDQVLWSISQSLLFVRNGIYRQYCDLHLLTGLPQATIFIFWSHYYLKKYILQNVSFANIIKAYEKKKKNWKSGARQLKKMFRLNEILLYTLTYFKFRIKHSHVINISLFHLLGRSKSRARLGK